MLLEVVLFQQCHQNVHGSSLVFLLRKVNKPEKLTLPRHSCWRDQLSHFSAAEASGRSASAGLGPDKGTGITCSPQPLEQELQL